MKWTVVALLLACVAASTYEFDMERDLIPGEVSRTTRIQTRVKIRDCKTNAECLRKNMPLLPPKPKRPKPKRAAMKPRASPCVPQTFKGYLRAYNADTGADMGYLREKRGLFGYYGTYSTVVSLALGIQFDACPGTALNSIDITIKPSQQFISSALMPFLGVAASWEAANGSTPAFGPSDTVLYLAAVSQTTGPDATPNSQVFGSYTAYSLTRNKPSYVETQVWNFDPVTNAVTATWINYNRNAYTGQWVNNPDVSSVRGNQLAASGDQPPEGFPWARVKLVFDPSSNW